MKKQHTAAPSAGDIVFLKGKKVNLRPICEADMPYFQKWINDPEIRKYLIRYTPVSEATERAWIAGLGERDSSVTLGISYKEKLIGSVGLHAISWKDRTAEVGISIGETSYQEKGLGTDAAMTLAKYAFDTLNMHHLVWKAKSFNVRSIKCAQKCGFIHEGRIREHMFVDGQYHDETILGLLDTEWTPVRNKYFGSV